MPKSKATNLSRSNFSSSGSNVSSAKSALSYFSGQADENEAEGNVGSFADMVKVARKQLKDEGKLVYKPGFFNKPLVRAFLTGGGALAGVAALSLALGFAVPVVGPLLGIIVAGVGTPLALAAGIKAYKDTQRINFNKASVIANRMRIGQTNADVNEKVKNILIHKDNSLNPKPNPEDFFSLNFKKKPSASQKDSVSSNFDEASTEVGKNSKSGSSFSSHFSGSGKSGSECSISPSDSASNLISGSSKSGSLKSSSCVSSGKRGEKHRGKFGLSSKEDASKMAKKLGGFCYFGACPTNEKEGTYTSRKGGWGACSDQGSENSDLIINGLKGKTFDEYHTGNVDYTNLLLSESVEGIYRLVDKSSHDVRRCDASNICRRSRDEKCEGWGNKWNIDSGGNTESILIGNKCSDIVRAIKLVGNDGSEKEFCWNKDGSLTVKQGNALGYSVRATFRPDHKTGTWNTFVKRFDPDGYKDAYDQSDIVNNREGITEGLAGCVASAVADVERGIRSVKFYNSRCKKSCGKVKSSGVGSSHRREGGSKKNSPRKLTVRVR